ncbi:MAG: glycosyltransferase family 2 protein [Acidobacteria bacterium]|nr:glycosyltransferase family 2 protein [Acidobacteriota bacterium]
MATEPLTRPADVSVVIVTRSNRKYLEPCLASLIGPPFRHTYDVVIVDNGSTDGTQDWLKATYPVVALIDNGANVGLSRACNQGIAASTGRYVLLLNDDTLVTAEALDGMVDFLDRTPEAGAVGGRLMNEDGTVQACYNSFSTLREEALIATRLGEALWPGYPSVMDATEVARVDWICSACIMLRRAALDQVGLLDEEYFIYGDEVDLQFRLQKAGWGVYFLPGADTLHYGGRSLDRWRRRRMVYRGKMLFYRKHYGPLRTVALRLLFASLSVAKLAWWGMQSVLPWRRERAAREITSNLEVVRLCARLQ